jgi:hypothetical protein
MREETSGASSGRAIGSAWWYTRFKLLSRLRAVFSLFRATFLALGRVFKKSDIQVCFSSLDQRRRQRIGKRRGRRCLSDVSSGKVEVIGEKKVDIVKRGVQKKGKRGKSPERRGRREREQRS